MKLAKILTEDRILVPLDAEELVEAVGLLCQRLEESGALPPSRGVRLAGEFFSGARGEVVRASEGVALLAARSEETKGLVGALGIAAEPFSLEEWGDGGSARVLLLLLTPRRVSTLKIQVIPALTRFLREREHVLRLQDARSPAQVLEFGSFLELELEDQLLVADGLTPLQYRIYPDTPLEEVVGLMTRRNLRTVPVVGEKLELLGLVTSGEVMKHLLPRRLAGGTESAGVAPLKAREVMTRSIMCVSEEQSLVEAANLMVNKGVAQLPVVQGGELVGFLTAESALQALFGPKSRELDPGESVEETPPT